MTLQLPPAGSRGGEMPGGAVLRYFGVIYAALHRLVGGRVIGGSLLLLTTIGSRSGLRRTAVLAGFPDGDGRWLVVGSAGGAAHHPAWCFNLASHPDQIWAQVGPHPFKVTPELLGGADRADAWRRIVQRTSNFAGYEAKTDRVIPVVRLTKVAQPHSRWMADSGRWHGRRRDLWWGSRRHQTRETCGHDDDH